MKNREHEKNGKSETRMKSRKEDTSIGIPRLNE